MSKVKVRFLGNLGKEPEVKSVGEIKVAKFNVAVTSRYKNKNGEYEDKTKWMAVEAWRGLAEIAEKYLKKGSKVLIEGTLEDNSYTSKDGQEKTFEYVVATELEMLNRVEDNDKERTSDNPFTESQGDSTQKDDDLPF